MVSLLELQPFTALLPHTQHTVLSLIAHQRLRLKMLHLSFHLQELQLLQQSLQSSHLVFLKPIPTVSLLELKPFTAPLLHTQHIVLLLEPPRLSQLLLLLLQQSHLLSLLMFLKLTLMVLLPELLLSIALLLHTRHTVLLLKQLALTESYLQLQR